MSTYLKSLVFVVCVAICAPLLAAKECKDSNAENIRVNLKFTCDELTSELGQRKVKVNCKKNVQKLKVGCCKTCAEILGTTPSGNCEDQNNFKVELVQTVNCAGYKEAFETSMASDCLKNTKKIATKCCATCKQVTAPEPTPAPKPAPAPIIEPVPVVGTEMNIIGLPTTQASSEYGGHSARAADGVEETNFGEESCTQTASEHHAWWTVSLLKDVVVTKVKMLNRQGWADRLSNIHVLISDEPLGPGVELRECGIFRGQVAPGAWGTVTCTSPTRGRFVTLQLDGNNHLTLCEVKVYAVGATPKIPIVGNPTSQSSISDNGYPALAVDGIKNRNYGDGSCTHTRSESEPWWSVDLSHDYEVTSVAMLNRRDCCSERLSNVYVLMSDSAFENRQSSRTCGQFAGQVEKGSFGAVRCTTPTRGRYVTLMLSGHSVLTLCEVMVYGNMVTGN